jgi:predicted nucleic acid-binding protein
LIVCDNSVLSALAEIGQLDLLPALWEEVAIPASVAAESRRAGAPVALQVWIEPIHLHGYLS